MTDKTSENKEKNNKDKTTDKDVETSSEKTEFR